MLRHSTCSTLLADMTPWLLLTPLVINVLTAYALEDSRCQQSGVVADPEDCSSFLVCAGGQVVQKVPCPPEHVFSVEENTCVPAEQVPDCSHSNDRVTRATAPQIPCKQFGAYCEGCDKLIFCANVSGQPITLSNVSCGAINPPLVCDSKANTCAETSAECPNVNFVCVEPGFYPDPENCKINHYCSDTLEHSSDTCVGNYDGDLEECTSINSSCPPQTITECKAMWTAQAILPSKTFYRVCVPNGPVYSQSVRRCPEGQKFDDAQQSCRYICDNPSERYADPVDCHYFYNNCSGGSRVRKRCNEGMAFNKSKKMCVKENEVANCRQSSTTSTTTAAPTKPMVGSGFQCTGEGHFADSSDCRKYYACSSDLQKSSMSCPIFTRFNANLRYCTWGGC